MAACDRLSCASGSPTCSSGVGGCDRHRQGSAVGESDVLAGEDHHPADDESGVLAGFEHPRQPVHGGVGVRPAHRLDERADDVVVVVASVAQRARCRAPPPRGASSTCPYALSAHGDLERGQHLATVAARPIDRAGRSRRRRPPPLRPRRPRSTSWRIAVRSSGSSRNSVDRLRSGALTSKNGFSVVAPISVSVPSSTAGSSASCCDLENRWISSRNRIVPCPRSPSRWRAFSMVALHVLDAGVHRRELLEGASGRCRRLRAQASSCRFPVAPRSSTDDSRSLSTSAPQRPSGADEMLLADDVVERARAQSSGERRT